MNYKPKKIKAPLQVAGKKAFKILGAKRYKKKYKTGKY
jgi:hypothetical protein